MKGIFEHAIEEIKRKSDSQMGVLFIDDIADFIFYLQENKFDSHIIIQGQNGTGKSYLMLALMKRIAERKKITNFEHVILNNIFYAYHDFKEVKQKIAENENSVFGIDEGKKFLHYKMTMTAQQIRLINIIEYARSRKNALVVCTNNVRRLDINYRNSKVQVVIWLLDRLRQSEERKIKNYGIVFVGLPSVEEEDKFLIDNLVGFYNTEGIRVACENLPTMAGYLLIDDIKNYLTENELQTYEKHKDEGIRHSEERDVGFMSEKELVNDYKKSLRKYKYGGGFSKSW